jgi:hypothetical protein
VKTGSNLEESSKEDYGSKMAVLMMIFFIDVPFADDHILLTKNDDDLQYSGYNLNNKSA